MLQTACENDRQITKNSFKYTGSIGVIYYTWFKNLILTILTLGIYSFWGRNRIRKYFISHIELAQNNLQYIGTGLELFLGFLKALCIIIAISIAFSYFEGIFLNDYTIVIFVVYWGCTALYSAFRYRISRVTYRNIRIKLKGSALIFGIKKIIRILLNIMTLGILIPSSDIKLYKYIIDNIYIDNVKPLFKSNTHSLTSINLITLILAIPTFGLSRFWYQAALYQYLYDNTTIKNLRLKATYKGGGLLMLYVVNILLAIITLGIALPLIKHRNMKYFCENTFVFGDINNFSKTDHDQESADAVGEGLIEILDINNFVA